MTPHGLTGPSIPTTGSALHALCAELYPILRSITGDGVRRTLTVLQGVAPVTVHEVPSGTPVLDWVVPREWNVREAWIAGPDGRRLVDVSDHGLHLVSYSSPVGRSLPLAELRQHVHTLPDRPAWIPYRTSYWRESWGFCAADDAVQGWRDGTYHVHIDSTLADGSLTYGEVVLPGESEREILISTHVCHPWMANDNASGMALAATLAARLADRPRRHTFRFLFVPGTIGAITWLARNRDVTGRIDHGLVLTGLGDPSPFTYKCSRRGDTVVDRAAAQVLCASTRAHRVVDWSPYGYDERQYCSPGFDLPVGRLGRATHGEYPQYHTSADDLAFIDADALGDSLAVIEEIVSVLEGDERYRNASPFGEPQLGRRGLYRTLGGDVDAKAKEMALLWVLSGSDGSSTLLDISCASGLPFTSVRAAADALVDADLLAPDEQS